MYEKASHDFFSFFFLSVVSLLKQEMGCVSLLIHHGGVLIENKNSFEYHGGEIYYYIELISYLNIEDALKILRYNDIIKWHTLYLT